jgi:hypothetical protein
MTCFVVKLKLLTAVGVRALFATRLTGYFQTVLIVKALVADSDSDIAVNKQSLPMTLRGLFSCLRNQ